MRATPFARNITEVLFFFIDIVFVWLGSKSSVMKNKDKIVKVKMYKVQKKKVI